MIPKYSDDNTLPFKHDIIILCNLWFNDMPRFRDRAEEINDKPEVYLNLKTGNPLMSLKSKGMRIPNLVDDFGINEKL